MPARVTARPRKMPNPLFSASTWRRLFWLCTLAVLVLALLPPSEPLPTTGWDKGNHLLAFAVLFMLGHRGYPGRTGWLLAGLVGFGVLIEFLQALTPFRDADWHDVVADSIGLLIGLAFETIRHRLRAAAPAGK